MNLNFISENPIEYINIKKDDYSFNCGTLEMILDVMTA